MLSDKIQEMVDKCNDMYEFAQKVRYMNEIENPNVFFNNARLVMNHVLDEMANDIENDLSEFFTLKAKLQKPAKTKKATKTEL